MSQLIRRTPGLALVSKRTCGCHSHNGFLLSPEGLAQRELELPGVDGMELSRYLDIDRSVSGPQETLSWDDALLEDQYRRFLNGS